MRSDSMRSGRSIWCDGNGFEVGGPVVGGQGVERAADPGDIAENLALLDGRGALELHVLDPVGEAGLAGELVAAADAVPGPDGDDRRGVIFLQKDFSPLLSWFQRPDWRMAAPCRSAPRSENLAAFTSMVTSRTESRLSSGQDRMRRSAGVRAVDGRVSSASMP